MLSLLLKGVYLTSPRTILNRSRRQSATGANIKFSKFLSMLSLLLKGDYLTSPRTILNRSRRQSVTGTWSLNLQHFYSIKNRTKCQTEFINNILIFVNIYIISVNNIIQKYFIYTERYYYVKRILEWCIKQTTELFR